MWQAAPLMMGELETYSPSSATGVLGRSMEARRGRKKNR